MFRYIKSSLSVFIFLTVLVGVVYPAVVWAIGQSAFSSRANGSLITEDGKVVGSSLIAQSFTGDQWFQPRPSAVGFSGSASGASNLSLKNPSLTGRVAILSEDYRKQNNLPKSTAVPADAVTQSGSGLDPDISIANALLQARRVARARSLSLGSVDSLIRKVASNSPTYLFGTTVVNVVVLNLELMKLQVR